MSEQVTQELSAIQERIQARDFHAALQRLQTLLNAEAENVEALYMQAVCQRYLQQHDKALATLADLKTVHPEHGRAHQEEGYNYRARNDLRSALRAFERACYYNPALASSFKARIELLQKMGQVTLANTVKAQLAQLQELPKPLLAVIDLVSQGKLIKAETLCRQFLRANPRHVEGMRLLADIGLRLGVLSDAEYLLESAVEFAPDNVRVRIDYIQALRKRQNYAKALEEAGKLLATAPDNPQYQSLFAIECMQTGDFDKALKVFNGVLEKLPNDPATLTSKGHVLKTRGDADDAIQAYQQALQANPMHGEAYYSLANLKTYTFTSAEITAMRALLEDSNLPFMDRVYVSFALGKAYEDEKNYSQSFDFYARGNALKKAQSRYVAERMTEELQAQGKLCQQELFARHEGAGCPAPDPIFIVGLPRAGSTLLEQILSSHSQIDGTLELPNILSLSQQLRRQSINGETPGYPAILESLSGEELRQFGEEFIRDTRIHRQGAPYFIDKMPNNFRHIGLIKLILPNAKIIDARRNAMACCFSGYKQLFAEGQEFSYSLTDIADYCRDYVALMAHWQQVLPGFVLQVNNEEVIDDLEGQVRRMLDFCGLPFESACLNFHETKRNVRTPSAEQVRRPVSRAGVDQWRNYAEFLQPLQARLGDLA